MTGIRGWRSEQEAAMKGAVARSLNEDITALAEEGLNWMGFVPAELGPIPEGCIARPGAGLLILLSLGPSFGSQTAFAGAAESHPFDARAVALTRGFTETWLLPHDPLAERVYPGQGAVDLRAWLRAGAVQYDSELGIGIRPDCGTWFAVRSAVWVAPTPQLRQALQQHYPPLAGESPCKACTAKPCLGACPAGVFREPEGRLLRCAQHRVAKGTSCADRCASRLACPVGAEYRYEEPQMSYHYGVTLRVIRDWMSERS